MKHLLFCGLLCYSLSLPFEAQDHKPPVTLNNIEDLPSMTKDSTILPPVNYKVDIRKKSAPPQSYKVSVKMTIHSDRNQIKRFNFGYQDQITVFVNGENIYLNNEGYSVRSSSLHPIDEFFDYLFIPLKKGKNQVVLEGVQTPGGIGIRGQWADLKGIEIK